MVGKLVCLLLLQLQLLLLLLLQLLLELLLLLLDTGLVREVGCRLNLGRLRLTVVEFCRCWQVTSIPTQVGSVHQGGNEGRLLLLELLLDLVLVQRLRGEELLRTYGLRWLRGGYLLLLRLGLELRLDVGQLGELLMGVLELPVGRGQLGAQRVNLVLEVRRDGRALRNILLDLLWRLLR